jgi:hypothetical protein
MQCEPSGISWSCKYANPTLAASSRWASSWSTAIAWPRTLIAMPHPLAYMCWIASSAVAKSRALNLVFVTAPVGLAFVSFPADSHTSTSGRQEHQLHYNAKAPDFREAFRWRIVTGSRAVPASGPAARPDVGRRFRPHCVVSRPVLVGWPTGQTVVELGVRNQPRGSLYFGLV